MKKLITLLLCVVILQGIMINVSAGELDANEQSVIKQISSQSYGVKVDKQYINQLENYFMNDNVSLQKMDSADFVQNFKLALQTKEDMDANGTKLSKMSDAYIKLEKACSALGLLLEYDSSVNDFYFIDGDGYIVLDFQKVIKDTDSTNQDNTNKGDKGTDWNISIEIIFTIVVGLCILGLLGNLKRWNRRNKIKSKHNYDDEEEDDNELEVANRRTRRNRLQTFTYRNVKHVLKYFYIPIVMGLIVVIACFAVARYKKDIINSFNTSFVNTQPLYISEDNKFVPAKDETAKLKTIDSKKVTWPRYSQIVGELSCSKLNIDSRIYFGDRGEILTKGVGIYSGSGIPGAGKTILVGGHDTTEFAALEGVKLGDKFQLTTSYGIYTYIVKAIKTYDTDKYNDAYNLSAKKEKLVLYTCYPFGKLNGTKSKRMFVYLDKTSGPDIVY